ncbi:MAG: hypothetical protein IH914_06790, partial [candidate division Zixibacteria bacterium]|nr:hypothetical protein [candidate division Zixibacteria bacterium]
ERAVDEITSNLRQEYGRGDPAAIKALFHILADGGYVKLTRRRLHALRPAFH